MPMLVGEVRWAIAGPGCSCRLSGGSQWSAAPTWASKNAQVCRASVRRKRCCAAFGANASSVRGWLIHHAIAGEASHSSSNGIASHSACGRCNTSVTPSSTASSGPIHISRHNAAGALSLRRSTSLEVRHCSRWRWLIAMRHSVRTIASRWYSASCGSHASPSAIRARCCMPALKPARRCWSSCTSRGFCTRSSRADSSGGTSTIDSTATVHECTGEISSQPVTSSASTATGTRLRRRLSRIFQRDNAVSALRRQPACAVGAHGSSHGSSCQSPRIQRCRRFTSAP